MRGLWARLVDLRAGEGRLLLSLSVILALVTGAHTLLETARDTLFLSKLPAERLALVYVLLAGLSLLVGALSSGIAGRFGRRAGFVITLGLSAYAITVLYLRPMTSANVFMLYVTSGVLGTILTLQFWLFAGQMFSVAQGKRLFGAMAAGGVLGATLGATAAAILLRFLPATSLLVAGALMFLAAAVGVTSVPTEEDVDAVDLTPVSAFGWLKDVSVLRENRYVSLLGALVVFSTAAVLLADYLFKSVAARELGPERLGPFLGTYYAVQNAVALAVQLVLTGPLVRRLGVTSTLLIFPLLLASTGVGLVLTGAFGFALAVKATDGSLRHSLHRVTSELLLLPLPADLRDKAKRVFDTMLGRGSQAVAATLIVVLAIWGQATTRVLGIMVLVLAAGWLVIAFLLRAPYLDVFRRALQRGELPEGDQELDLAAVETLLSSLASPDEVQVVAAIDLLAQTRRNRLLPALILYHESPVVLEHALAVFASDTRRDVMPLAERLLGHRDPSVRGAAVRALAASGNTAAAELALHDADPGVRAHAAFFLVPQGADPLTDARIVQIVEQPGEDGMALRRALLGMIGEHGDHRFAPVVTRILAGDERKVCGGALAAAAVRRTQARDMAPYLVLHLAKREGRAAVRSALAALDADGFRALSEALSDSATPLRVRLQIPRSLAVFRSQEAVDLLTERLAHEPSPDVRGKLLRALGRLSADAKEGLADRLVFNRALFEQGTHENLLAYLRQFIAWHTVRKDAAHATSELLTDLLKDRLDQTLERVFRLIQLGHRNEDILSAYLAVVRGDRRARATALEFLDVLTLRERDIRPLLRLAVDELEPDERVRRARELMGLEGAASSRQQVLEELARDEDELLSGFAKSWLANEAKRSLAPPPAAAKA